MKHKIKPFDEFKKINRLNEDFYNPFEKDNPVEVKPSHIADKGGLLKLRKEVFNINRVEYSKNKSGKYCVLAKTQFAKGEIVEIAPVIFVGLEAKAVSRLKDYIFEIDKSKGQYGVVLGYGSLYGHSPDPNVTFAYNKENRQMYFIAAKTINAGAELTINYGDEYWQERSGFSLLGNDASVGKVETKVKGETDESMIQPNAEDITDNSIKNQFSQPNSNANPAISGIAIRGANSQA
jgi:uncharacterized protein